MFLGRAFSVVATLPPKGAQKGFLVGQKEPRSCICKAQTQMVYVTRQTGISAIKISWRWGWLKKKDLKRLLGKRGCDGCFMDVDADVHVSVSVSVCVSVCVCVCVSVCVCVCVSLLGLYIRVSKFI